MEEGSFPPPYKRTALLDLGEDLIFRVPFFGSCDTVDFRSWVRPTLEGSKWKVVCWLTDKYGQYRFDCVPHFFPSSGENCDVHSVS